MNACQKCKKPKESELKVCPFCLYDEELEDELTDMFGEGGKEEIKEYYKKP